MSGLPNPSHEPSQDTPTPDLVDSSGRLKLVHPTDEVPLPSDPPAPTRKRWLLAAGAIGGSAVFAGGLLVSLAVLALSGAGIGYWLLTGEDAPAPVNAVTAEEPIAEEPIAEEPEVAEEGLEPAAEDEAAPEEPDEAPAPTRAAAAGTTEAAPPAPEPAAPASGPQAIKLFTDPPAASVYVDGSFAGRTPLKLEVAGGDHEVRIQQGRADETFHLAVGEGTSRWCYGIKGRKVTPENCS